MQRRKQIDYQAKTGNHQDYDYEFAYELGAEVMKDKMQRKDEYLKNLNQRKNNQNHSVNRVEFSNNETMRPMREEYYASQEYEPMDDHKDYSIEKQNQKNDNNFRKR